MFSTTLSPVSRISLILTTIFSVSLNAFALLVSLETTRSPGTALHGWDRRAVAQATLFTCLTGLQGNRPSFAAYIDPSSSLPTITKRIYLDVQIGAKPPERLVIGLFGEIMPRTAENFEKLCEQNLYAGTTFYRVLSDYNIQGGAIGDASGRTGMSSFGVPFPPDNFNLKHSKAGLVSAVSGPGGNVDSRFVINSMDDAGWADDRYAAFGIVEEGLDFVKKIEKVDVAKPSNKPKVDVTIVASGVLP